MDGHQISEVPRFDLKDFTIKASLGRGAFGFVRLIKNNQTKKYYAIKELKKKNLIQSKQIDHIYNEIVIQNCLKHNFMVNSYGFSQDKNKIYILLDFVQGGEFFLFLRKNKKLAAEDAAFYLSQVVIAIKALHKQDIVFRDLKPENLLIDCTGYLRLADFGFAKKIRDKTYTLCGTPEYLAPEILLNQGHGKPVDWWTIGVLLYEMIAGLDPFSAPKPIDVYKNILKGKIKFSKEFNSGAKSLVKHLLKADLSERYGCLRKGSKDVTYHRFFKQIDWDLVKKMELTPPYIPNIR